MPVTNQDIKEKLEGIEDALTGVVDDIKETAKKVITFPLWVKIVAGLAVVCLIAILVTMFTKSKPVDDSYLKDIEVLQQKIETLTELQTTREALQQARDSFIVKEISKLGASKQTQTRIIHEYNQIPDRVNSLDREQLRREITEY